MCVASIVWVFCLSIMGGANCAVPTCPAKNSRHKGLSFHRIPRMGVSDPWRRQVLAKIDRVDRTFLEQSKQHHAKLWVCSRHYKPECFKTGEPFVLLKCCEANLCFLIVLDSDLNTAGGSLFFSVELKSQHRHERPSQDRAYLNAKILVK